MSKPLLVVIAVACLGGIGLAVGVFASGDDYDASGDRLGLELPSDAPPAAAEALPVVEQAVEAGRAGNVVAVCALDEDQQGCSEGWRDRAEEFMAFVAASDLSLRSATWQPGGYEGESLLFVFENVAGETRELPLEATAQGWLLNTAGFGLSRESQEYADERQRTAPVFEDGPYWNSLSEADKAEVADLCRETIDTVDRIPTERLVQLVDGEFADDPQAHITIQDACWAAASSE